MKNSSLGRLVGALVAPGETFRSIAERPTWVPPLMVLLLLALAVSLLIQQKTDPEEMVRGQIGMMGMEVPEERVDEMVEQAESQGAGMKVAFSLLGVILQTGVYFLVAFLFWVAFRLLASEAGFLPILSATLHGFLPLAVAMVLNLPLMMSRESLTFEEVRSGGVLVSSLAPLAPEDAPPITESLLGSFDLFSVWTVVLLTLGFRAVARVSTAMAAGTVLLFWLIYIGGKLGFVALFSR